MCEKVVGNRNPRFKGHSEILNGLVENIILMEREHAHTHTNVVQQIEREIKKAGEEIHK